jgi:hypothetical protein
MKTAIIHSFHPQCQLLDNGSRICGPLLHEVSSWPGHLVSRQGIALSLISVLSCCRHYTSHPSLDKRSHPRFHSAIPKEAQQAIVRSRWVFIILILVLLGRHFGPERQCLLYGENAITTSSETKSGQQQKRIDEVFGAYNPVVLLIPNGNIPAEIGLARELEGKDYMDSVQGLVTLADPYIPRELLPKSVVDQFSSTRMSRMILALDKPEESPETLSAVEDIHKTVSRFYGTDYYLLGSSTSVTDIKTVVDKDSTW